MELLNNEILIDNYNFSSFLKKYFGVEYSLGVHGVDDIDCWKKVNGEWQLDNEKADKIKNLILENGLFIQGNRTLLSTVRFNDIDEYLSRGYYDAGGVIVALPKFLKNSVGEEIFIGNVYDCFDKEDRNYTFCTLSDIILPNFNKNQGFLDSIFILAKYEKKPNDKVKLIMNAKHLYFNGGILADEFFELKKKQIIDLYSFYNLNSLYGEKDKLLRRENLSSYEMALIRTIEQLNDIELNCKKNR